MSTIVELVDGNAIAIKHAAVTDESGLHRITLGSKHTTSPVEIELAAPHPEDPAEVIQTAVTETWQVHTAMSVADWATDQDLDPQDPAVAARFERMTANASAVYALFGGESSFDEQAMSL